MRAVNAEPFLAVAVAPESSDRSPFSKLEKFVVSDHDHFITRETAVKVLDALPDAESRLPLALSRFGDLCRPSEPMAKA